MRSTCTARRSPSFPSPPRAGSTSRCGWSSAASRSAPRSSRQAARKRRRRKTIPPEQLQMVLDGELDSTFAYSFIVTDIPAEREVHRGGRALPPPARADRGALQGRQARPGAAPPALRQAGRQPPVAVLLPVSAQLIRLDMRPQPGGRRLRPGRRGHAAAPPRQDAAAPPVLRARPDRAHRPADHRAPTRGLPALRALQRHLPRRARAPRPLAPGRPLPKASIRNAAQGWAPRESPTRTFTAPVRGRQESL